MSDHRANLFTGDDGGDISPRRHVMVEDDSDNASDWGAEHNKSLDTEKILTPDASEEEDEGGVALYCTCLQPEAGFMLGCDGCDDWFHGECIGVTQKGSLKYEKWFCPGCTKLNRGITTFKRTEEPKTESIKKEDVMRAGKGVFDANNLLGKKSNAQKRAALAPLDTAPSKKQIALSKIRTEFVPLRQAPLPPGPPPTFSPARVRELNAKLKNSLPGDWRRPFGHSGYVPKSERAGRGDGDDDHDGDDGSNNGDDGTGGNDGKYRGMNGMSETQFRAANAVLAPLIDTITRQAATTNVQRRTYIDVEENPTVVDEIVKNTLEEALFGRKGN